MRLSLNTVARPCDDVNTVSRVSPDFERFSLGSHTDPSHAIATETALGFGPTASLLSHFGSEKNGGEPKAGGPDSLRDFGPEKNGGSKAERDRSPASRGQVPGELKSPERIHNSLRPGLGPGLTHRDRRPYRLPSRPGSALNRESLEPGAKHPGMASGSERQSRVPSPRKPL